MYCKSWAVTHVGMKRDHNEDSYLTDDALQLYVVADGMGGHTAGEMASATAVSVIEQEIGNSVGTENEEARGKTRMMFSDGTSDPAIQLLTRALRMASSEILEKSVDDTTLKGMGTTTSAMFFADGKGYLAHVGDSRIYKISSGNITQLTTDHSLVQEQVEAGLITKEEAERSSLKNIITRSIGFEADIDVDCESVKWKNGEHFLLCSDGLTNFVTDKEIRDIVSMKEEETALEFLVNLANQRGGDDNITVILVKTHDGERPE